MIKGLNHITIAVSDLERSLSFYTQILGMNAHVKWNTGAYLTTGSLWVCLSCDNPKPSKDYTHIAFDIAPSLFDTFKIHIKKNKVKEWKQNQSEGESIYILDPDGHKLEVHVGSLETRMEKLKYKQYDGLVWL